MKIAFRKSAIASGSLPLKTSRVFLRPIWGLRPWSRRNIHDSLDTAVQAFIIVKFVDKFLDNA